MSASPREGGSESDESAVRGGGRSEEEQILTCPACMKILTQPMTLSCIHVFCSECTSNLKRVKVSKEGHVGVQCPICSSHSREMDIQPSVLMTALVDEYHKLQRPLMGERRLCDQCEGSESFWRCHECKIHLCEKCVHGHQRIPYCRGHRSIQAGLDTELNIDKVVFCTAHPDMRIEFNCADCEAPMCDVCRTDTHESHLCETVEEALDRLRPIHEKHCEELDGEISLLQRDVDALDNRAAATDNVTSKQELTRIRDHILDLMTKYHTLRWWITLAMNRSRGAFLLSELQGHVKQRLDENGREPPRLEKEADDVMPPLQQEPKQAIRAKRPDDKKPKRAHLPPVLTRCSIHSFLDILNHRDNFWQVDRQVQVAGDGCARIGFVNESIWLAVRDMDHIKVLDPHHGALLSVIEFAENTRPWVVQQINHDTIIMAAENGLYNLNPDGSIKEKLHDGTFNDVNADGNYRFVALEYTVNKAMLFHCRDGKSDSRWSLDKVVKLRTRANHHLFSSIMMLNDTVVGGGNTVNAFSGVIHKYGPSSRKQRSHKTSKVDLRRPVLCGIDSKGFILLADTWRDKILVMSADDTIRAVKLHNQVTIRCPKDILLIPNDTMWLLMEEAMGSTIMVKYTRSKNPDREESDVTDDVIETSQTGSDVPDDSGSAEDEAEK